MKWSRITRTLVALAAVGCLVSCQAVFTFSPLSFLQRDPAGLSADQQVGFAEEALASGDADALRAAYDALVVTAATSTDPDVQYTAAQLALELSGVSDVFTSLLGRLGGGGGDDALATAATAYESIDVSLLSAAADYLDAAESGGADLTATDYFVGGVGLIIAGAEGEDPFADLDANPNAERAEEFLTKGADELAEGDPARELIESFLGSEEIPEVVPPVVSAE